MLSNGEAIATPDLFGDAMPPSQGKVARVVDATHRAALSQYFTPAWAAEALVDRYFANLSSADTVIEPSCGTGAFLAAIPDEVCAIGVEIDPALAQIARRASGRQVIVGDFCTADLPVTPTALIGNPPFSLRTIEAFLDRAWQILPDEARAGFILPAYSLQTPATIERLSKRWSVQADFIPRSLFPRISRPICFAVFTKGTRRGWVGFALFHEAAAVARLQARYRALLNGSTRSAWVAVTQAALESLGGRASLQAIYREIEGVRPTSNPWWKEKVRQVVQRIATRTAPGEWALQTAA